MFKNLIAEMARFDVSKEKLASILCISVSGVYDRLNAGTFRYNEAISIRDFFNSTFGTHFTLDYLFNPEPIIL